MGTALLQSIINGVLMGSFYSLIGMGLNCVYSVMKIINFCQGDLLMLGMYVSFFAFQKLGIDPYLSIPLVILVMIILAIIIQYFLVTPMLKQSDNTLNLVFLTVGLSMLMQNLAQIFFTSNYRTVATSYNKTAIQFLGLYINKSRLISFFVCLILTFLLFFFFKKANIGKQIRATSQNATGAKLVGIKINSIYIFTFALGAALAGIAGTLLLPFYYAYPTVGAVFGTRSFAVIMLGGLGNIKGAFIAGICIGVLETVSALILGSSFQDTVVCVTFLVVLVARQQLQKRRSR